MRFVVGLPQSNVFMLRGDGTYDSEGYLGYGTWKYRKPRLVLTPDVSRLGPPVAFLYQDYKAALDGRSKSLTFEMVGDRLRFCAGDPYHVGKHWTLFVRTAKPMRHSAQKLATGRS